MGADADVLSPTQAWAARAGANELTTASGEVDEPKRDQATRHRRARCRVGAGVRRCARPDPDRVPERHGRRLERRCATRRNGHARQRAVGRRAQHGHQRPGQLRIRGGPGRDLQRQGGALRLPIDRDEGHRPPARRKAQSDGPHARRRWAERAGGSYRNDGTGARVLGREERVDHLPRRSRTSPSLDEAPQNYSRSCRAWRRPAAEATVRRDSTASSSASMGMARAGSRAPSATTRPTAPTTIRSISSSMAHMARIQGAIARRRSTPTQTWWRSSRSCRPTSAQRTPKAPRPSTSSPRRAAETSAEPGTCMRATTAGTPTSGS